MTKTELRNLVITNTNRSDKATTIDLFLDFALSTLARSYAFDDLRKTLQVPLTSGGYSVQLPVTLNQIIDITFIDTTSPTSSYPMKLIDSTQFLGMFPNIPGSTTSGRPTMCCQSGNLLLLNTKTNAAYQLSITGYTVPKFFSATDENPIVDSDEAVVAYATARLYYSMQMYKDGEFWERDYQVRRQVLINGKERRVGTSYVAQPWQRSSTFTTNSPWLDPFAGQSA